MIFQLFWARLAQIWVLLCCFGFRVRFLADFRRCCAKLAPRWRPRATGWANLAESWGPGGYAEVQGRRKKARAIAAGCLFLTNFGSFWCLFVHFGTPLGEFGVKMGPDCLYLIPHGPNLELIGTAAGRPSNVYVSLKEPTKVTDKVAEHTCATLLKMVVSGSLPMLRFIPTSE